MPKRDPKKMIKEALRVAGAALCLSLAACSASGTDCVAIEKEARDVKPGLPEGIDGLEATIIKPGRDHAVGAGDIPAMHYTGWLFDADAEGGRGKKFDSSRDRGQTFDFPLGGGRVIKGWDLGVAGMQIGEVRELKIAPELGYGDRGAGSAIPPGATLLFEVELVSFQRCTTYD